MDRILIIEDDENLGVSMQKYFKGEGHQVELAKNLAEAREKSLNKFDCLVLDWMLPDGQGIDFLRDFRQKDVSTPIIMLTARTELIDKVLGLESGANDYLTKPFEPRELLARIRVQLRQKSSMSLQPQKDEISVGDIKILLNEREIYFQDKKLELTKMEYELLKLLVETPNRVFSREEILNKVWGYENYPSTRTVDTHILQLRQKTDDDMIETIRGIGYRFKNK